MSSKRSDDNSNRVVHFSFAHRAGTRLFETAENLRKMLCDDPNYQVLCKKMTEGSPIILRTYLKTKLKNEYDFDSVQISFEEKVLSAPFNLRCNTFFWKNGYPISHYEFPDDPALPSIRKYYEQVYCEEPKRSQISALRYIAGKRLTFRKTDLLSNQPDRIGKFLPGSKSAIAYARLQAINDALCGAASLFRVAPNLELNVANSLFFQACLPGSPAKEKLNTDVCLNFYRYVGRIHADIHKIKYVVVKHWSFDNHLSMVLRKLDFLCFIWPEYCTEFTKAGNELSRCAQLVNSGDAVFCHGDFGWAQMLIDRQDWSVIDFDDPMMADPYLEIGKFMAGIQTMTLFHNYPELLQAAANEYIVGYSEEAGIALDSIKLLWYELCAIIIYLSRVVKKDRVQLLNMNKWKNRLNQLTKGLACLKMIV